MSSNPGRDTDYCSPVFTSVGQHPGEDGLGLDERPLDTVPADQDEHDDREAADPTPDVRERS